MNLANGWCKAESQEVKDMKVNLLEQKFNLDELLYKIKMNYSAPPKRNNSENKND